MDRTRILVVEDKEKHQRAAQALLANHEVIVKPTFDEAIDVLKGKDGFMTGGDDVAAVPVDALLTDLFYTQGRGECQASRHLGREEFGFGFPLTLIAALQGVPKIGVVTDMNHHDHPMAYTFDHLKQDGPARIRINDAEVMFFDERDLPSMYKTEDGRFLDYDALDKECPEGTYPFHLVDAGKAQVVKNWSAALDALLEVKADENA
tara:strand:+ start:568 stop:1185 length:618 start_codon:yes stop_codon:yes gene_type:complete